MSTSLAVPAAMEEFLDEGLVTEVLSVIKSGKEAAAYLCRGSRTLGHRYAVAKVYHDRTRRNFANDSVYAGGNSLMNLYTFSTASSRSSVRWTSFFVTNS